MAAETFVIKPEHIDAFLPVRDERGHRTSYGKCWMKKCSRAGSIRVMYREHPEVQQRRAYVCVQHATELANQILSTYKFGRS